METEADLGGPDLMNLAITGVEASGSGTDETPMDTDNDDLSNINLIQNGDTGSEKSVDQKDDVEESDGEEHEFEILDQLESADEAEGNDEGDDERNDRDRFSSDFSDVDDAEVHAMLEKGVDKESIAANRDEDSEEPIIRIKSVMQELENADPFDILPPGWVHITHQSGMAVYLHKETRVCTMSRPYTVGFCSVRGHDVPISAIPCFQYRKQLEKKGLLPEKSNDLSVEKTSQNVLVNGHSDTSTVQEAQVCPVRGVNAPLKKVWCVSQESSSKDPAEVGISNQEEAKDSNSCQEETQPDSAPEVRSNLSSSNKMWTFSNGIYRKISVPSEEENQLNVNTNINQAVNSDVCKEKSIIQANLSPNSPQENIAVSFNSSKILREAEGCDKSIDNTDITEVSLERKNTAESLLVGNPDVQMDLSPNLKIETSSDEKGDLSADDKDASEKEKTDSESLEDGEILSSDEESAKKKTPTKKLSKVKPSQKPQKEENSAKKSEPDCAEHYSDKIKSPKECPVSSTSEKPLSAVQCVVSEEVSGSVETSELVTSSTNPLAAIKRKLESLKTASKARKLEARGTIKPSTPWLAAFPPTGQQKDYVVPSERDGDPRYVENAEAAQIVTAEDRARENILQPEALNSYCRRLFLFKTVEVKKYSTWRIRRKRLQQDREARVRPELPTNTKLITCPVVRKVDEEGNDIRRKKDFLLNPTGKSYLCILHEYLQRTMQAQPVYNFTELENSKTPYAATVSINSISYGTGYASSKKVAKQEAAKDTLKLLIPELFTKLTDNDIKRTTTDLSFFDDVKVDDPRVNELCVKVGQPRPYHLLLECLKRNFGLGHTQCEVSTKQLRNQKCEFTIVAGKHTATIVAKNKREGKQLAAQMILDKLHPHINNWGSVLRLYGTNVEKPAEKVEQLNEIKTHAPNQSVLDSLRREMKKLHSQKEAIQPIGTMIVSSKDLPQKLTGVDI